MYSRKDWLSRYDDTRHYNFLWKRDDYQELMTELIEWVYEMERGKYLFLNSYIEIFFMAKDEETSDLEIKERQDHLLGKFIERRHNHIQFMEFLFTVIAQFSAERRKYFFSLFLSHNKYFGDFKELPLQPNYENWWGSAVLMLQGKLDFFESLLPLLNTVDLLQHKQYIERIIDGLHQRIELEKKQDFIDD